MKKENNEKGKNERGHSKTHRYSPCSPSCRHDIKYRLKKERWMADTWLKTGLVLVTRSQRNEAVGCSTVQVGCQMVRTETVNEGTKRNERNTVHHEYATRQTRPREPNTNFEFLSRDSGHLFSFCSTRCKISHNYTEKKRFKIIVIMELRFTFIGNLCTYKMFLHFRIIKIKLM